MPTVTAPPRVSAAIAVIGAGRARALAAHGARVPAFESSTARYVPARRAPAKAAARRAARPAFAVAPAAIGVGRAAATVAVARYALAAEALVAGPAARHRRAAPHARRHAALAGVTARVAALRRAGALRARVPVPEAADCLAEPVGAGEAVAAVGVGRALGSLAAAVAGSPYAAQPEAALRVRRARAAHGLAGARSGLAGAGAAIAVALAAGARSPTSLAGAALAREPVAALVVVGARQPCPPAIRDAKLVLACRARAARGGGRGEPARTTRLAASRLAAPVRRAAAGVGGLHAREGVAASAAHAGPSRGDAPGRSADVREARAAAALGVLHAVRAVGPATEGARPVRAGPLGAAVVVAGAGAPEVLARALARGACARAAVGVGRAHTDVDGAPRGAGRAGPSRSSARSAPDATPVGGKEQDCRGEAGAARGRRFSRYERHADLHRIRRNVRGPRYPSRPPGRSSRRPAPGRPPSRPSSERRSDRGTSPRAPRSACTEAPACR